MKNYKKISVFITILMFLSFFLHSNPFKLYTYIDYSNSNYKSYKWDYQVKKGYENIEVVNYYEAINNFLKAVEKGCTSPYIHNDIILLYLKFNDYVNIFNFIETYWEKSSVNKAFEIIAYDYLDKKNFPKSIEYFEKTNKKLEGYKLVAIEYLNIKDYDNALLYFQKIENPQEGYQLLAEDYLKNNNLIKAAEYYEKLNNPSEGLRKLANAFYNKKDFLNAEKYFIKSGITDKDFELLALGFERILNIDKAVEYYTKIKNNEKILFLSKLNKIAKNLESNITLETTIKGSLETTIRNKELFVKSLLDTFSYRQEIDKFVKLFENARIKLKSDAKGNNVSIIMILEDYNLSFLAISKDPKYLDFIAVEPVNLISSALAMYKSYLSYYSNVSDISYDTSLVIEKKNNFCIFIVDNTYGTLKNIQFMTADGQVYYIKGEPYGLCYYIDPMKNPKTGRINNSSLLYAFFNLMKAKYYE